MCARVLAYRVPNKIDSECELMGKMIALMHIIVPLSELSFDKKRNSLAHTRYVIWMQTEQHTSIRSECEKAEEYANKIDLNKFFFCLNVMTLMVLHSAHTPSIAGWQPSSKSECAKLMFRKRKSVRCILKTQHRTWENLFAAINNVYEK